MKPLPSELLKAFRAAERPEHVAVLLHDDEGWNAESMRVLTAWEHTEHRWTHPKTTPPDGDAPTTRAWRWLVSGWDIDITAVADAADVSRTVAQAKIDMLIGNRLIYPDGGMHHAAHAALKVHVASRLPKSKKAPPAPAAPPAGEGN